MITLAMMWLTQKAVVIFQECSLGIGFNPGLGRGIICSVCHRCPSVSYMRDVLEICKSCAVYQRYIHCLSQYHPIWTSFGYPRQPFNAHIFLACQCLLLLLAVNIRKFSTATKWGAMEGKKPRRAYTVWRINCVCRLFKNLFWTKQYGCNAAVLYGAV